MDNVCYIEDAGEEPVPPPGWKIWRVSSDAACRRRSWFHSKPMAKWVIVYRGPYTLPLNDLEVVSFVRGKTATGYVCSCDLMLEIVNPEFLVADLGTDEGVVTEEGLRLWLGPRVMEVLKDVGESHNLEDESAWPNVCRMLHTRLSLPQGIKLETCTIREVRRFEKRIEEVRLIEWFHGQLAKAAQDGRIALVVQQQREAQFLAGLGEEKVKSLLSAKERRQPAAMRLKKYLKLVGLKWADVAGQLADLHKKGFEILDRVVAIIEKDKAEKALAPIPASFPLAETAASAVSQSDTQLAVVLDQLEELQVNELKETLDELERLQTAAK